MAKAKAKRKGKKKGKQAKLSRGKKARKATKSKARKGAAKKKKKAAARKPSPQRTISYSEPTSMADTTPEVTTFGSDTPQQGSSMESSGSEETSYSEYGRDGSSPSSM